MSYTVHPRRGKNPLFFNKLPELPREWSTDRLPEPIRQRQYPEQRPIFSVSIPFGKPFVSGMVSIIVNALDRYDSTVLCIGGSLANTGYDNFEFLCCDNASKDRRTIEYIASLKPACHLLSERNLGWAGGNNQMLYRARGEYICSLDTDMLLPNGWLAALVEHCVAIPETGVVSISIGNGDMGRRGMLRDYVIWRNNPLGVKLFHRRVVERVGFFDEGCGLIYYADAVSYTHLRAHETPEHLVCRLLLEKKKIN